jgi:hypothetical protein
MKIKLNLVDKKLDPYTWSYDQDTVILITDPSTPDHASRRRP